MATKRSQRNVLGTWKSEFLTLGVAHDGAERGQCAEVHKLQCELVRVVGTCRPPHPTLP